MGAQSQLAKLGMRIGTLGSIASLAIAAPLSEGNPSMVAHTDATRIGVYFDRTSGGAGLGVVAGGIRRAFIGEHGVTTSRSTPQGNDQNEFFGYDAGNPSGTVTGTANSAFGWHALSQLTSGNDNNAFGRRCLEALTTGNGNIAIGRSSLYQNQTASYNIAIGWGGALGSLTSGGNNIVFGSGGPVGTATFAYANISFGWLNAGDATTVNQSVMVGDHCAYTADGSNPVTSVDRCIFIGYGAGGLRGATLANTFVLGGPADGFAAPGWINKLIVEHDSATYPYGPEMVTKLRFLEATTVQNVQLAGTSAGGQTAFVMNPIVSNDFMTLRLAPNGAATVSSFEFFAGSDINNSGRFLCVTNPAKGVLATDKTGTASTIPMVFRSGPFWDLADDAIVIGTGGQVAFNRPSTGFAGAVATPTYPWQIGDVGSERMVVFSDGGIQFGGTYATPGAGHVSFGNDILVQGMTVGLGAADSIFNVALGYNALASNTYAGGVIAIGRATLQSAINSSQTVAIGTNAMVETTTGTGSTAVGFGALRGLATSNGNTAIGQFAGDSGGSWVLSNCTFIGASTYSTASGITNSMALGYNTQVTASNQVVLGNASVVDTQIRGVATIGLDAIIQGVRVGRGAGGIASNTIVGRVGLGNITTGTDNALFGDVAGYSISSGSGNAGFGAGVLSTVTSGGENSALGYYALGGGSALTGLVAVGYQAMSQAGSGTSECVAVGHKALKYSTSPGSCTAIGYGALRDNPNASGCTAIGPRVMWGSLAAAVYNTAVGYTAMLNLSTGTYNCAVGERALSQLGSGSGNTAIGAQAGSTGTPTLATISNCTFLGYQTRSTADAITNSTAIGYGALVTASNQVVIGNASVTETILRGVVTSTSRLALTEATAAGGSTTLAVTKTVASTGATTGWHMGGTFLVAYAPVTGETADVSVRPLSATGRHQGSSSTANPGSNVLALEYVAECSRTAGSIGGIAGISGSTTSAAGCSLGYATGITNYVALAGVVTTAHGENIILTGAGAIATAYGVKLDVSGLSNATTLYGFHQLGASATNYFQGLLSLGSDVVQVSTAWHYFGDPATDGTWRIGRSGNNMLHQRRESGTYIIKLTVEA